MDVHDKDYQADQVEEDVCDDDYPEILFLLAFNVLALYESKVNWQVKSQFKILACKDPMTN